VGKFQDRRHLHLADHHHLPLGGHDVDLAFRASPVAVEHAQPGALQVLRSDLLALTA
jgi:hypothetical protein